MEKKILIKKRWLRALGIAKILFEDNGYFTDYLSQIEQFIKTSKDSAEKTDFLTERRNYVKL